MSRNQEIPRQVVLMTIPQAAKMLSLSRAMVYLLIKRGELHCIHIGRAVRVSQSELRRFVQEREAAETRKR